MPCNLHLVIKFLESSFFIIIFLVKAMLCCYVIIKLLYFYIFFFYQINFFTWFHILASSNWIRFHNINNFVWDLNVRLHSFIWNICSLWVAKLISNVCFWYCRSFHAALRKHLEAITFVVWWFGFFFLDFRLIFNTRILTVQ